MNPKICGHDRDHLRWALRAGEWPAFNWADRELQARYDAHEATTDPDKLAEIAAELLRECTGADVVIFSPVPGMGGIVAGRTPSRLDYVVYWDRNHGGTIQVKPPCSPDDPDMSKLLVMQQARDFVLKLLDKPSEQCLARMLQVP